MTNTLIFGQLQLLHALSILSPGTVSQAQSPQTTVVKWTGKQRWLDMVVCTFLKFCLVLTRAVGQLWCSSLSKHSDVCFIHITSVLCQYFITSFVDKVLQRWAVRGQARYWRCLSSNIVGHSMAVFVLEPSVKITLHWCGYWGFSDGEKMKMWNTETADKCISATDLREKTERFLTIDEKRLQ